MRDYNNIGDFPIKPNTSLAEAMAILFKASGLIQIIRDIVSDAMKDNVEHSNQETKEQAPEFYTKSELCQLLHISETTLWRLVTKKKAIREHKVGGKSLYLRSEIDSYIASGGSKGSSSSTVAG